MEKIVEKLELIVEEKTVSEKRIRFLKKCVSGLEDNKDEVERIVGLLVEGDVKKSVIKEINKFLENDKCENSKEIVVSPQINTDEIIKLLDQSIKKYSGFSDKKPMDYVGFNITNKSYTMRYKGQTKTAKDKKKVCETAIDLMKHDLSGEPGEIVNYNKLCIPYKNKNLILFISNNNVLFDIQHVISLLELQKSAYDEKYNDFSPRITNFICAKNEYGGYIIRELIPEEVMYEIILSSTTEFSKSFKKDVSMIIKKAREDGKLFIIPNTGNIVYENMEEKKEIVPMRKFLNVEGCDNDMTKKVLEASATSVSCVYLFTIGSVGELRETMKIDEKYSDDCIVVKYGKTEDLLRRTQEHHTAFKKYDGNAKLKYYAWVDVEYQSKAEIDIKKYFKRMNKLFSCDSLEEIAILSHEELKEVKDHYSQISNLYCGKLKNLIDTHKEIIRKLEKDVSHEKHKCELLKKDCELFKKEVELFKKEGELLKKDCEMLRKECDAKDKLLLKESEMTELYKKMLENNKNTN